MLEGLPYANMKQQKIVGYCRISTLEQTKGYGIEIQERDIERYARERGWLVAAIYKDEAQSGVKEHRAALQRLLRSCKAGRIETVIVASLDRLSRSLRFAENLFFEFERLGVTVCIVDMPHYDGNDAKDVMMRQINEVVAEHNRTELIRRLKKGREARARDGKLSGGNLPYGYGRDDGTIHIIDAEAEVVRTIFALDGQARTAQQSADTLNARGDRRRNGQPWTERQVRKVLSRRARYVEGGVQYGNSKGKNPALVVVK